MPILKKKKIIWAIFIVRQAGLIFGEDTVQVCGMITHRRRNRGGGHRGYVPPQPAGKGGSAPTARAVPFHTSNGPVHEMSYELSKISSYEVCSDRLIVHFFIVSTKRLLLSVS